MSTPKSPLIALKSYEKSREIPNFLGIMSQDCHLPPSLFQALSPHVMEWEPGVWIFDLRFTKKFWQIQAQIQGISGPAIIEQILNEEDALDYLGVLAKHPWQLVFMLAEIKEQARSSKQELIHLEGPFGQSLLKQAGWTAWHTACQTFCAHWETIGSKQFKEHRLASKIKLLQASMKRLGIPGPNQLPVSSFESMKRRFGKSIATLWEWSLLEARQDKKQIQGLFSEEEGQSWGFPWI